MYQRTLINQLRKWSLKKTHKPLVIRGARQVGKSTLVEEFGREFDVFIEVNLELSDDAVIFLKTDNVQDIWQYLCLRNHVVSDPAKRMLLFIDEIQEVPKAVGLLRYFREKMPWLYVITAGSRLQSLLKKHVSFPVGRVDYLNLRPFSFEEYVNALHGEEWLEMLRQQTVPALMHQEMMNIFNQYALIGGMPEVVATFAENPDVENLATIFQSLLKGYNEDVERYTRNEDQVRIIRHVLDTAWYSAAETITFANFGGSSYTSTQIHEAMTCLEKAYILSLDYPVTSTLIPLVPARRRSPKLIMVDSGITNFVAGIQIEYLQNKDLLDTWRGRAAEQIVAQELRVLLDQEMRENHCFWVRDKKGTKAEIDFVWQHGTRVIPIEVKAGTNSHLRSLHSFVNTSKHPVTAVRFWSGEFFVQDAITPEPDKRPYRLINIPFYYIGQLRQILQNDDKSLLPQS
ncbi:MAG: AAA family ATPase [Bacteroidaceae bacterium]|nr:AAA family ATPase [Bacteroidaceae bacterium]